MVVTTRHFSTHKIYVVTTRRFRDHGQAWCWRGGFDGVKFSAALCGLNPLDGRRLRNRDRTVDSIGSCIPSTGQVAPKRTLPPLLMLIFGAIDFLLPLPLYLTLGCVVMACRSFIDSGPHRSRMPWLWSLAALWAWIFSAPFTANELTRWVEGPKPERIAIAPDDRSLIVVLASGELRPRLDQAGWERLQGGLELRRQVGGQVLFVGGPGHGSADSLGRLMADAAVSFGQPSATTASVGGGRNTYEDIVSATPRVLRHEGPIWLVTSALHMPRAMAIARRQGWQAKPYPVDYQQLSLSLLPSLMPSNGGPGGLAAVLHELIGQQVYRLRGWIA